MQVQMVESNLAQCHLQATLSQLLTYCALRPTQPLPSAGREMGYGVKA